MKSSNNEYVVPCAGLNSGKHGTETVFYSQCSNHCFHPISVWKRKISIRELRGKYLLGEIIIQWLCRPQYNRKQHELCSLGDQQLLVILTKHIFLPNVLYIRSQIQSAPPGDLVLCTFIGVAVNFNVLQLML